jgi:hypothetical protein
MGRHLYISMLILSACAVTGCNRAPSAGNLEREKLHMIHVAGLAGQYTMATKKPATDIEDVKAWAIKQGKAVEEDFISLRDKKPYGLASGMGGAAVFETVGKNGRCYLWQTGAFREVPQAQAEEMAKANAKAMAKRGGPPGILSGTKTPQAGAKK